MQGSIAPRTFAAPFDLIDVGWSADNKAGAGSRGAGERQRSADCHSAFAHRLSEVAGKGGCRGEAAPIVADIKLEQPAAAGKAYADMRRVRVFRHVVKGFLRDPVEAFLDG